MANLGALRIQISTIRAKLTRTLTFVGGRPPNDVEVESCERDLSNLAEQVSIIIRDLKSAASFSKVRAMSNAAASPAQRYSVNQSLQQRDRDIADLIQEFKKLDKEINDLLTRNGLYNAFEIGKEVLEQAGFSGEHEVGHNAATSQHSEVRSPDTHSVSGAEKGQLSSLIPVATFTCLMLKYAAKKIKSLRDKSAR